MLEPDATNLPAVLFGLQGERGSLFQRLVEHLREIFSTVGNLSVAPVEARNDFCEIRVWPTSDQPRRELSFGLDDSGTGVGQVIAILVVVMTFEKAVVVIDEISSFLHPAAVKALLRILQTYYNQHQYIISTHSPEVLSAANPSSFHLVRRDGYTSVVESVDLTQLQQLREVADHLGVSMTDVFGAERILWVEGDTEELCFPFIYKAAFQKPLPHGLAITAVIATGDFGPKVKRRDLIIQIYRRLSQAAHRLVKSVCFSFDREGLTPRQMADLTKQADIQVAFLPRRHLECFLIDPAAIAAFIVKKVPDLSHKMTPSFVEEHIKSIAGDQKFKAPKQWKGDINDQDWLAEVDGAKMLKHLCEELSYSRAQFNKKNDSLELLQHIMANNPSNLKGLIEHVKAVFELVGV